MADLLPVTNGSAVPCREIPVQDFEIFRQTLLELTSAGANIVHFFGYEEGQHPWLMAILRQGKTLLAGRAPLPAEYPALTRDNDKFHLFERELAEQFGIIPLGHPWLKSVRYHPNYNGGPDVFGNDYAEDIPGRYPYFQVQGEEIHEVGVGPVHAGIIEPGHFRFQCIGERVLHLEIQLGYQHRDVERLLTTAPAKRLPVIAESIAGDTAIGNSLCFSEAIEALAGDLAPANQAQRLRVVALELERLANHVGDLGALSGDVAFNPPAAFFGRLRGEFLNLLLLLCGNRFGKGLVRPGGLALPVNEDVGSRIQLKIDELEPQVIEVADLLFTAHTVLGRFDGCGVVPSVLAEKIGLVGVAGRASGLLYDVRVSFPSEAYKTLPPCEHRQLKGDVFARAWTRYEEIVHSFDLIKRLLSAPCPAEAIDGRQTKLAPSAMVTTLHEAWRGELSHCVITDDQGRIGRYKIKDPSFHNWTGLALALRNEGISDFPLNNKSFNLSYCGVDL